MRKTLDNRIRFTTAANVLLVDTLIVADSLRTEAKILDLTWSNAEEHTDLQAVAILLLRMLRTLLRVFSVRL